MKYAFALEYSHNTSNIPHKMSNSKPKLADLDRELNELSWSDVVRMAVHLGMKLHDLNKISGENRQLEAMQNWLDCDPEASWDKIVKALNVIKKIVLAQRLEKRYCSQSASSSVEDFETTGTLLASIFTHVATCTSAYLMCCRNRNRLHK